MFLLKAQKHIQPPVFFDKLLQVANSGSTWGWHLLEGVKNLKNNLWKQARAWYLTIFSSLINCYKHDGCQINRNFFPKQLPTHPTVLTFFLQGAFRLADLLHHYFLLKAEKQTNLNLPLFLYETILNSWPHSFSTYTNICQD